MKLAARICCAVSNIQLRQHLLNWLILWVMEAQHLIAGTKLYQLLLQSVKKKKKLTFWTRAFFCGILIKYCIGNPNSGTLFIQRNVPPGYHKGSILKVWLYVSLHIQDSQTWEKGENEQYREGENKKGGNGKYRLFVLVHMARFTTKMNQYHMDYASAVKDKGHFIMGKKEKANRTKEHSSTVFSICLRFAFTAVGTEVLVMYCGFFTPGWVLANDYFIYVLYSTCFMCICSFCLTFLSPSCLGLKKAPLTRWKNDLRECRGGKKNERLLTCARKKEM